MNILFLSELFYPHGGGAELAIYLYAKLLAKAGFNIVVVTNCLDRKPSLFKREGLTICRMNLIEQGGSVKYSIFPRFDILLSSFMRKMIKWSDIVYIPRLWFSAIPLAKMFGKPVMIHLHDYIPVCPLSSAQNLSKNATCNHKSFMCSPKCIYAFERNQSRGLRDTLISVGLNTTIGNYIGRFVELSDAVICVSKAHRNIIVQKNPHLHVKTHVIYNPLPEPAYSGIEGEDFGYFGGPQYLKGFHVLLEAMASITADGRKSIRIHATKFTGLDKQFDRNLLRKLGILPYGKLGAEQYDSVCRQIQAVIVPSIWPEPWPYVVVEALVGGKLVIASSIGGIPEQVDGCKGALLCEPANVGRLVEAIECVKNLNGETKIDLGQRNRETFLKKFNNETSIRKFISLCESLT